MRILRQLVLTCGLLLMGTVSRAQILVTFDQNPISMGPGDTATFTGELRNTGLTTLFLNGDSLNLAGSGLTFDDTPFLINAPFTLAPGDVTASFEFFTVTSDNLTPVGTYNGAFSVLGGLDGSATNELSGTPPPAFQVNVANVVPSAVPEPGDIALLSGLVMTGTGLLWKRRCRRKVRQDSDGKRENIRPPHRR